MTPQEAQAILDSRPQQSPEMTPEMAKQALMQRLGGNPNAYEPIKHIAAGVTKFGQNLANLPNNLTGGLIPEFSRKSFDPYQTFGTEEGLADKIGVGMLDFAPFLGGAGAAVKGIKALGALPGSAMLKTNVLAGAGYGSANNQQDRLMGAAEGAGLGAAAHGVGLGAGAVGNAISNAYAKSSIPALVDKAGQYIRGGLGDAESGAKALKGAYDAQVGKTDALWKSAQEKAGALDSANMKPDPSAYNKTVENFIKEKGALEPAKREKYLDALDFAKEKASTLAPQSFSGVIDLRQRMNDILGNFSKKRNLDAPSREMKEFAKDLKFSLNDVVGAENKNASSGVKDFYKTWTDANKATTRTKEFYQSPNSKGKLEPNRKLEGGLGVETPEGSLIQDFLPKDSQTGIHGYQQLSNLLGNKEAAQQGLRNYEFRNLGNRKEKDALDAYQSLSPTQREVMFDKDASGLLGIASDTSRRYFPGGREKDGLGMSAAKIAGYHLLPGAIAGGGAYGSGHDARAALGIGLGVGLGSKAAAVGLGKYAAKHPQSVREAMLASQTPTKYPGQYVNPLFQSYFGSMNK